MFNMPTYDTDDISLGPGVIFLGPVGSTPAVEVGAVRSGSTLTITREVVDVEQGTPAALIKSFARKEMISLTFRGLQWSLRDLAWALGAGVTAEDATEATLGFGGDMDVSNVALMFRHELPVGHTVETYFWAARGSGEVAIEHGDDPHEFPYTFNAVRQTVDWNGDALASQQQLFKIVRKKA